MLLSGLNMFELNRIGLQQAEICVFSVPIWGSAAALNEAEKTGRHSFQCMQSNLYHSQSIILM